MNASVAVSPKDPDRSSPHVRSLLNLLNRDWSRWAESRSIAYIFFAALYILPSMVLARQKLIWDDEFFTLYLSKIPNWSELWRALSTGADQHPPTFYYLTHLIFRFAGASHLTLRSTAIAGFGVSCVCLYEIARRLLGARWAAPAMLAPITAPVLYYATEARGYGLELGFATLSLLMWILATEDVKRAWTVPALAIALCLAVASHYYALLFLLPLMAGEFAKAWMRRSIDVPVCCAFLAAFIPLLLFAPLILRAKAYAAHFWAVPHWSSMLDWYPNMTGRMLLLLPVAAGLMFFLRMDPIEGAQDVTPMRSLPVVTVLTVCSLLPVAGGIIAQFITHASTERYFITALPGVVIIMVWGLKRVFRNDFIGPALVSALCVILFVQQWREQSRGHLDRLRQMRSVATLLRRAGDAPVVVSEVTVLHQLSFYARRDLVNRLVYTADPHLSVSFIGHDTIDRGMLDLVSWFPLRIVWWRDWWSAHPYSLVYGYVGGWAWSTFALPDLGTVQLVERDVDHLLFAVTRTKVPVDDRVAGDPSGKPLLYDQLPAGGPPLCQIYLPTDACPVVDDATFTTPIISYPDWLRLR
jgi:hypothetical protein